jgi:hypothetical protein
MWTVPPDLVTGFTLPVWKFVSGRGAAVGAPNSLAKVCSVIRNEEYGTRIERVSALAADRPAVIQLQLARGAASRKKVERFARCQSRCFYRYDKPADYV